MRLSLHILYALAALATVTAAATMGSQQGLKRNTKPKAFFFGVKFTLGPPTIVEVWISTSNFKTG